MANSLVGGLFSFFVVKSVGTFNSHTVKDYLLFPPYFPSKALILRWNPVSCHLYLTRRIEKVYWLLANASLNHITVLPLL